MGKDTKSNRYNTRIRQDFQELHTHAHTFYSQAFPHLSKIHYFCATFCAIMSQNAPIELGRKPIGRLLLQYATPAIIAMTASSLYNNIDRIFIGQCVGPMAISGLATTFPFMNLAAAFGAMVGVGASTLISVRLGQKDYKTANHVLGNTITLNLILGILFTIVCWAFLDPILYLFGASRQTLPYARDYMEIILLGNVISHSYFGLNAVLRAAGHPRLAMRCTIITVILNAILDPIFIWYLNMGIRGAAIATIISQATSLAIELWLFSRPREIIHLQHGIYRLNLTIIRQTLAIGLSPFLMNSCACLVVLFINRGMRDFGGDYALGAYGIVNSVIFFFLMIVMGLNQGMQPIVGYNWGARQDDRVWHTLRLTIIGATVITVTGFVIGEFIPETITHIFTTNEHITQLASHGFRLCVSVFPLVGAQMVIGNFFQSIGHAGKSIFLSISRQMLFLIPLLNILPRYMMLDGVWLSIPISDSVSFCFAIGMLLWEINHIKSKTNASAKDQS